MSLSIILDENRVARGTRRTYEWHVGEKFPLVYHAIQAVQEIQADGDELVTIHRSVMNIPLSPARVVRWFDSDAKFICGVLQMEYRGRE